MSMRVLVILVPVLGDLLLWAFAHAPNERELREVIGTRGGAGECLYV